MRKASFPNRHSEPCLSTLSGKGGVLARLFAARAPLLRYT